MDAHNLPQSQPEPELPHAVAPALEAVATLGYDTTTCAICLDPLRGGATYVTVKCGHKFHLACVGAHAARRASAACPLCRDPLDPILAGSPPAGGEPAARRARLEYTLDEALPPVAQFAPPVVTLSVVAEWVAPRPDGTLDGVATLVVAEAVPARAGVDVVRLSHPCAPSCLVCLAAADRRRALQVCLLDVSGSMYGGKLEVLKQSVVAISSELGESDRLCLLSFNDRSQCLMQLTRMTGAAREVVRASMASLHATGGTDIQAALDQAAAVLSQRRAKNAVAAVLLLSDGQATVSLASVSSETGVGRLADVVSTIGIGADHDAHLLSGVAKACGGIFAYADTPVQIAEALGSAVGSLTAVVACDARLVVTTDGAPELDATQEMGLLYAGESKNLLFTTKTGASPRARLLCRVVGGTEAHTVELVQAPAEETTDEALDLVDAARNRTRVAAAIAASSELAHCRKYEEAGAVLVEAAEQLQASRTAASPVSVVLAADIQKARVAVASPHSFHSGGQATMLMTSSAHAAERAPGVGGALSQLYSIPTSELASERAVMSLELMGN